MLLHQEVKRSSLDIPLLKDLVDLLSVLDRVHQTGGECLESFLFFFDAIFEEREVALKSLEHFVE